VGENFSVVTLSGDRQSLLAPKANQSEGFFSRIESSVLTPHDVIKLNAVLQGDFTDYVTEDGEKYRIGGVTEYLSRFNLVSQVLDTETALDLIAVVQGALKEITELGHELASQIILVTDNGPAMKSRRFRNFVNRPSC
jgi:hypothetical protein